MNTRLAVDADMLALNAETCASAEAHDVGLFPAGSMSHSEKMMDAANGAGSPSVHHRRATTNRTITVPEKPRMKSRRVLLALIPIAVLGGIGAYSFITSSEVGMKNTIIAAEAQRLVDAYVRETMTALPPQARLEKQYERTSDCEQPTDHGPRGRVLTGVGYWIRDLSQEPNQEYLDIVLRYWTRHGWKLLTGSRPQDNYIWVEKISDGFQMSIQANINGDLNIGTDSPCVWPNGMPEPKPQ